MARLERGQGGAKVKAAGAQTLILGGWSGENAPIRLHWLVALLLAGCFGPDNVEQPIPLYGEEPVEYPIELWDRGLEGETVLRVRVTDVGIVDSVEVMESSGHSALDSAAVVGVRELRFEPGRRNGERTRMWATLPVLFSRGPRAPGMD
jgi:TonB family protein